ARRRRRSERRGRPLRHPVLRRAGAARLHTSREPARLRRRVPVRSLAPLRVGVGAPGRAPALEPVQPGGHAVHREHAVGRLLPDQPAAHGGTVRADLRVERARAPVDRRLLHLPAGALPRRESHGRARGRPLLHAVRLHDRLARPPAPRVLPALAVALGTALAAVQLLPFLEWLPLSAEYQRRLPAGIALFDPRSWHEVLALPLVLFPNLYGNPTWPGPYRSYLPWGNYNENVLHVGTVALFCAL